MTFGSADSDAYQYDANTGRMTQYQFNMGTGPQTDTGALTWNANGTLKQLQITDQINTANSQTCTFGHDDLVRITSANCGAWAQTFGVDPFGNLTKSGSAQFLPTYTSSPPTNRYASIPGGSVTYDPNGNLTNDVTHAYTWDADGNMLSTDGSTVTMIYDALDRMIEQTRGAAHTQIVYAPYGMKLALMNGQTFVNAFVKLPGGARAVYSSAGLAYYRHSDHLGSSRLSTTTGRAKYYDVAYAPYGEEYNGSGTQDLAFTDQNQDTVKNGWSTNLYDFMFREYRTGHGRWTSPDPAGLGAANPENPQSWNRYAYVLNSPTSLIDPWGLREDCITKTTNYYVDAVYSGSEKVDVCYYIPDDVFGQVGGGQNTSQTGGGQSGGGNSGNTNNNANNNNQPQPPTPQCQQAQAKVADLKKQLSSPESKQEAKVYLKEMGVGTAIGCGIGAVPEIGTPFMVGGCVVGGIGGLELANAVYAVSHLSLIATALSLDAQLAVAEVKAVVACQ